MRIVILTHTFPRNINDTAAPFMNGVAEGLQNAGNQVWVLAPYSPKFNWIVPPKYKIVTYKYIKPDFLHKLGYSQTLSNDMSLKWSSFLLSPTLHLFGFLALWNLVRREKIELINAHWILPNGFIAGLVNRFLGITVVTTLPGSDVYLAQKNFLFRKMATFAASHSQLITSNSPQLLKDIRNLTPKKKEIATVIYGVDPKKFKPEKKNIKSLKSTLKIAKDNLVVVGVGRLVDKKGFKYLIQAIPKILKTRPNISFVIVGEGDQREELKKLVEKLKINPNVIFTGAINYERLIDYYNLADIFILPSIRDKEGNLDDQSVSIVEAMACGKPVITSNFPGYSLVVEDNINGFLVKEKDIKQITNSILKLAISKSLRKKFGDKSRKLIEEKFSWDAIGKQYTKLFKRMKGKDQKYYSQNISKILDTKDRLRIAKQITAVLIKDIGNLKRLNCLDVGCSSGVISNYLSNYFKSMTGIDIDKQAIDIAKSGFRKRNLKFFLTDAEKLNFKKKSFDVVILNQVYNFVDHPKKLMDEIYRVLKPGGKVFFSARNKLSFIEPQYRLPFLSWFPENLAVKYLEVFKKGKVFFGKNYMSLKQLKRLVSKFHITDYTVSILRNPMEYKFSNLRKYATLAKIIPIEKIEFLVPNFIWILEKPKDNETRLS